MSFTQNNNNNNNNLMGFSVHQPSVGAALQFFPAMGSKQLDEMINAYVPGNASILDKRTVVTCEFVQHSIATGELFKFFMVYPSRASDSPASLQDSGYDSFNTSPVISESQWTSSSTPSSSKVHSTTKKSTAADFSHIPGMKIMTREGLDVTNSASRGCKTKEQRDHAHLMRIIKACESCRKKKVRCDPSHKKRSSHSYSPEPKASKKARKSASVVPQAITHTPVSNQSTGFVPVPFVGSEGPPAEANNSSEWDMSSFDTSFDTFVPADEVDIFAEMESWDQFINYGDEPAQQPDWNDFNVDQFSPTTTFTSSTSPSQPRTPAARGLGSDGFESALASDFTANGGVDYVGAFASSETAPALPYLNPGGVESGTNYIDFNLYSPGSSCDEELGYSKDIAAASPRQESSDQSDFIDRVDHVEVDRPYDRSSGYRHKVVSDCPHDDYSQDWQQVRLRPSQVSAEAYQAATASNEAITASSLLHAQSMRSSQSGVNAVQSTGPAWPNKERVPCDNQSQPLISPDDPIIPSRPRDGREEEPHSSRTIVQTSGAISERTPSGVSQSTSQASIETSMSPGCISIPSYILVESARAEAQRRSVQSSSTDSSMHMILDSQFRELYASRFAPATVNQSSSQISTIVSEHSIAVPKNRSALEGRTSAMSQSSTDLSKRPDATSVTLAGTNSTASPMDDDTRSPAIQRVQIQLSKANTITSQYRRTHMFVGLDEALGNNHSIINSSSSEKTGVIAAIGLTTTLFDTMRGVRTSPDASLSAAALLWSMSRRKAWSDDRWSDSSDGEYRTTGEGYEHASQQQYLEALATVGCLAALTFTSGVMNPLHVVATTILAAAMTVLFQALSHCADRPKLSAQPLSLAKPSQVYDVARRFSQLRSNVGKLLFPQSSPQGSRQGSWQRLVL